MIDILWGFSKDICMISDVVWGKKSQKKDNDIYVQPLTAGAVHGHILYQHQTNVTVIKRLYMVSPSWTRAL